MLLAFPWLFVSFIAYNLFAFAGGGADPADPFRVPVGTFRMISGATWTLHLGDLVIALTLVLLFVEVIKATRTTATSIIDHALSMVLFVLCLVEFIVRPEAATSTFFLITLVTFIDVIAGFTITIKAARRDFAIAPSP